MKAGDVRVFKMDWSLVKYVNAQKCWGSQSSPQPTG